MIKFLVALFPRPVPPAPKTAEELRAEHWTRVTFPATWSHIQQLSRFSWK